MSGSSPCTLTTNAQSVLFATSAILSVPLGCDKEVITASPSNAATAFAMRSSSVATMTLLTRRDRFVRSYTHWIMGLALIRARDLPGKRGEPERGGGVAR